MGKKGTGGRHILSKVMSVLLFAAVAAAALVWSLAKRGSAGGRAGVASEKAADADKTPDELT